MKQKIFIGFAIFNGILSHIMFGGLLDSWKPFVYICVSTLIVNTILEIIFWRMDRLTNDDIQL